MKKKGLIPSKKTQSIMAIVRSADILNRYLQIELMKHDSNLMRFAVMSALLFHGGTMTPTAISKWVFRAKHSVTNMLNVLSEKGFIRRKPSTRDHRSVNIVVTKKGWEENEVVAVFADRVSKEVLSCFEDRELETFLILLKRLRKHLLKKLSNPPR